MLPTQQLISQSPNPGIEYEYRVPLPEYGGNPSGVGVPSASRPGLGARGVAGVPGSSVVPSPGQRIPFQGSPNLSSRSPSYGTRNPGQGGAVFHFGSGNGGRPGDTFMPLTPVLQPVVGIGSSSGFNSSNVSLYPINPQGSLGASPAGTPRRWPPYLGVAQGSSVDTGSRSTARLPGGIPRGQPITPLSTSRTGSLPRPWSPGLSTPERSRSSQLPGSPYVPGQSYPRGPGGNTVSFGGVAKGDPGREREVIVSAENSGRDGRLRPALTTSRDSELSVGGRQTIIKAATHHRGQPSKATTATPSPTHRTRHRHGFQGTQSTYRQKAAALLQSCKTLSLTYSCTFIIVQNTYT